MRRLLEWCVPDRALEWPWLTAWSLEQLLCAHFEKHHQLGSTPFSWDDHRAQLRAHNDMIDAHGLAWRHK